MKYALIIGNNKYDDPKLAQLKTPAADSQALAKILGDQTIGSFDQVTPLINKTETQARRAISTFLANKKPDDLVLLYFSGHGVLDDRGRLYLALKDTQVNLLKATSIPSSFVADEMDSCRSKRQILILDCCHSGAFARGTKGEQKAITETTFEGSGFGRVVLTASDSTQYALEGDQVIKQTELSLFTHFLLDGLKTGEADMNNDGQVSLDEWYDYTYTRVISETPRQVPHKWSYNQQGDLIIARNPFVKKKVAELPPELLHALESSFVGIRESAVNELGKYLSSRDPEMAALAVSSLEKMRQDDSRRISSLAEKLLAEFDQTRAPRMTAEAKPSIVISEVKQDASTKISEELAPAHQRVSNVLAPAREPSQQTAEKENPAAARTLPFGGLRQSFWLPWTGLTIALAVLLYLLYFVDLNITELSGNFIYIFWLTLAGVAIGYLQWLRFQDHLKVSWVLANSIAGFLLGGLHTLLYNNSGWGKEHMLVLAAVWLIGNFALGSTLIRETQEPLKDSLAVTTTGPRRSTFLLLLSVALLFYTLFAVFYLLDLYSLWRGALLLGGIAALLASFFFVIKKEMPRTPVLIGLVVFLFLDGVNSVLASFELSYAEYLVPVILILGLVVGIAFLFQRSIFRNRSFLWLAGGLISISLAYAFIPTEFTDAFIMSDETIFRVFLLILAFFSLLAAASFFRRK